MSNLPTSPAAKRKVARLALLPLLAAAPLFVAPTSLPALPAVQGLFSSDGSRSATTVAASLNRSATRETGRKTG